MRDIDVLKLFRSSFRKTYRKARSVLNGLHIAWLLLCVCPPAVSYGQARSAVVGVNVEDIAHISTQHQEALIGQLRQNGVTTIRTGMLNQGMLDPAFAHFITSAFEHHIGTVLLIYPKQGGTEKHTAPANAAVGRRWPVPALSDADPDGFRKWLTPQMNALEAAGVRLTAIELGNEFNTGGYNGDLVEPGSGRVLGIADLNNPNDAEARAVAKGYLAYLKVLAVLKDVRDHSHINRTTPVLVGGLANVDLPSLHSYNRMLAVSIPDSIAFLRQNGADGLVEGYGVHFYPSGDPRQPLADRIQKLQDNGFAGCREGQKPCWLTEWNISNANRSCPVNDDDQLQTVQTERKAIDSFVKQGRVAAILWYSWDGDFRGEKDNQGAAYRCGALTLAGKLALSPF